MKIGETSGIPDERDRRINLRLGCRIEYKRSIK